MNGPGPRSSGLDILEYELLAEKAAALGRAGDRAEAAVKRLRQHGGSGAERDMLVRQAADAVYAYFIQRELCGFRRHDAVIRELGIPGQVLARLGAV